VNLAFDTLINVKALTEKGLEETREKEKANKIDK
jgi:hypothetical protein